MDSLRLLTASTAYISIPDPLGAVSTGCNYWRRSDVVCPEDQGNQWADLGNAFHDVVEGHMLGNKNVLDLYTDKQWYEKLQLLYSNWKRWWVQFQVSIGTAPVLHLEVPMKYNPRLDKADVITGQKKRRDYSSVNPDTHIAGTADMVLASPKRIVVYDYKTGLSPVPATDPQMLVLGLMAAAHFGSPIVSLCVITVHEDGVWEDWFELGPPLMQEIRLGLCDCLTGNDPDSTPNPGPYCRYCPARAVCPAITGAMEGLQSAVAAETHRVSPTITGPSHAQWLATNVPLAEEFLERCKAALQAFADTNNGIALPGNLVYSGEDHNELRPKLTDQALRYLKQNKWDRAARRFTTWAALSEASDGYDVRKVFVANGWVKEATRRVYKARKVKVKT